MPCGSGREEHYAPRIRVRRSPGLHGPRGAASHARPPTPERNLRRAAPRGRAPPAAPTKRQRREVDVLLAWYAHPQPKPRLRAHRLVRASGRAAAGAAQPAGTMAPFARNDKTILEIALPALVGFNASVSFGAARLVDASPTARRRAEPRTAAMGVPGPPARSPRPALDGHGAGLHSRRRRYARATPVALARDRSGAPRTARSEDRDAHRGSAGPPRARERAIIAATAAARGRGESTPPTLHQTPLAAASSHWFSRPTPSSRSNANRRARTSAARSSINMER